MPILSLSPRFAFNIIHGSGRVRKQGSPGLIHHVTLGGRDVDTIMTEGGGDQPV